MSSTIWTRTTIATVTRKKTGNKTFLALFSNFGNPEPSIRFELKRPGASPDAGRPGFLVPVVMADNDRNRSTRSVQRRSNAVKYVVGIKRFNTTAILVDSNFSTVDASGNLRPNENPEAALMRNGVLYPGCIYGYSGNVIRAEQCIEKIRINVATAVGLQASGRRWSGRCISTSFPLVSGNSSI
jgi:hypothetical protein